MSSDYYSSLPRRRLGAGVLFVNAEGSPLIVEPTYKPGWEIPGGVVEAGEDPRTCAVREVREELRLDVSLGRLLVIDHASKPPPRGDSTMLIYDGGVLIDTGTIHLPKEELRDVRFVPVADLTHLLGESLAYRMRQALIARRTGRTVEIVNGEAV